MSKEVNKEQELKMDIEEKDDAEINESLSKSIGDEVITDSDFEDEGVDKGKVYKKEAMTELDLVEKIITNQMVRSRIAIRMILVSFFVFFAVVIYSLFNMYLVIKELRVEINKRPYLVLSDKAYMESKANQNLKFYIETLLKSISRTLLNINTDSYNVNLSYISSFSSYPEVIKGYAQFLEDKISYLKTINAIMFFIPEKVVFKIQHNTINSPQGNLVFIANVYGYSLILSKVSEPIRSNYRLDFRIVVDNSHVRENQFGLNIQYFAINELGMLK